MASAGLLALLDDIATLLDDMATLSKVAAKKTAGVLGDDLALNAQQVSGIDASRELPVVWAVAKGAFINKLILVPTALLISTFLPWLVMPLMMLGGLFLCFEGVEKLLHSYLPHKAAAHAEAVPAMAVETDVRALEKNRVKGAVRTDFILSAEIIVISLGVVQGAPILTQFAVISLIAVAVTFGVYGLVAAIVKFDDAGLALLAASGETVLDRLKRKAGQAILWLAPRFMRLLSMVGMLAMFLVGGGILVHGLSFLQQWVAGFSSSNAIAALLLPQLANAFIGLVVGMLAFLVVFLLKRVINLTRRSVI